MTRAAIGRKPPALRQPARGYRYSVDSLLLADFAGKTRAKIALDLGTGSGVVALLLLERGACARVVGIERQAELAACARDNAEQRGLGDRMRVVEADLRRAVRADPPGGFHLVVANPPFRATGDGRASPVPGRAAARHEGDTTLADFVAAARHALGRRGRFCVVLPASRLPEHTELLRRAGLEPKRVRFVHATAERPAHLVLCEATAGKPGGMVVEPPLFLQREEGS